MKTLKFALLFAIASTLAFGQAVTTNTTLSAAISANTTTQWCIASATNVNLASISSVGSFLEVDGEFAQVTTQGSSTTCFNVKRGQLGSTAGVSHASGAVVWVSNQANGTGDPSRPFTGGAIVRFPPTGSCVATAQYSLPVITQPTNAIGGGALFTCLSSKWMQLANSVPTFLGTAVASGTTITPTGYMFHVTGTTAIATISIPAGMPAGACFYIVPDGIFATTTAGNISLITTSVVNKTLLECWDGTKLNPSY